MMHRPTSTKYNSENGLVDLRFTSDSECDKRNPDCKTCKLLKEIEKSYQFTVDVPHYVRGAIQWPNGRFPGYALVSAQDQRDPQKTIWIFEEHPFWSVGTLEGQAGLWKFFEEMWKKYFCRHYFYTDSPDHRRYFLQVIRESLITMKPRFIEAEYASKSEDDVDNLIHEYQRLKKLRLDNNFKIERQDFDILGVNSNLYGQLESMTKGYVENEDSVPGLKALRALIAGYERIPYQTPCPPQEIPISTFR